MVYYYEKVKLFKKINHIRNSENHKKRKNTNDLGNFLNYSSSFIIYMEIFHAIVTLFFQGDKQYME